MSKVVTALDIGASDAISYVLDRGEFTLSEDLVRFLRA